MIAERHVEPFHAVSCGQALFALLLGGGDEDGAYRVPIGALSAGRKGALFEQNIVQPGAQVDAAGRL